MGQNQSRSTFAQGMAFSAGFSLRLKQWAPSPEGSLGIGYCGCEYRPQGHMTKIMDISIDEMLFSGEGLDLCQTAALTAEQEESVADVIRKFHSHLLFKQAYAPFLEPILARMGYQRLDDDLEGLPIYMEEHGHVASFYHASAEENVPPARVDLMPAQSKPTPMRMNPRRIHG